MVESGVCVFRCDIEECIEPAIQSSAPCEHQHCRNYVFCDMHQLHESHSIGHTMRSKREIFQATATLNLLTSDDNSSKNKKKKRCQRSSTTSTHHTIAEPIISSTAFPHQSVAEPIISSTASTHQSVAEPIISSTASTHQSVAEPIISSTASTHHTIAEPIISSTASTHHTIAEPIISSTASIHHTIAEPVISSTASTHHTVAEPIISSTASTHHTIAEPTMTNTSSPHHTVAEPINADSIMLSKDFCCNGIKDVQMTKTLKFLVGRYRAKFRGFNFHASMLESFNIPYYKENWSNLSKIYEVTLDCKVLNLDLALKSNRVTYINAVSDALVNLLNIKN